MWFTSYLMCASLFGLRSTMASKRVKRRGQKIWDEETVESPKNVTQDLQAAKEVEKHVGEDQRMEDEDHVSSKESEQCDETALFSGKSLFHCILP